MPKKPSLLSQISDFLNLYTLIFGAIMIVLGIKFFISGLYYGAFSISCYSLPLIVLGGILIWSMLEDKVYHRVFYRPMYPTYYSQQGYQLPGGSSYAQPSYHQSYQQTPQTVQQPSPQHAHPQTVQQHPQQSRQSQRSQPPQPPQPSYPPQPPQPSHPPQPPHPSLPPQSPPSPIPSETPVQPVVTPSPPQSNDTPDVITPLPPESEIEPTSSTDAVIDTSSLDDQSPLLQSTGTVEPTRTVEHSREQAVESESESPAPKTTATSPATATTPPTGIVTDTEPIPSEPSISPPPPLPLSNTTPAPTSATLPQPTASAPSASMPSAVPPAPPITVPSYSPPYYSGYGHGYGTPYYSQPYVTYVQYFRETLSIPQIRTLFYVFLVSIVGGSLVLFIGPPIEFLFPIFFIIAFTFPSFIWISYVYHKDILEPESKHGIFLALTWGMFSTFLAIGPNSIAGLYSFAIAAVIVAPLVEEFFKPLGITMVKSEMNSELDGLLYGVTCGMGFAIIENFSYEFDFIFSGDEAIVVWTLGSFIRGIGSTIVHAVGAGLIGFTFARLRIARQNRDMSVGNLKNPLYNLSLPFAYILAVALHAGWNGSATIPEFVSDDLGVAASIIGHILVFALSFHIIKSLANEGIHRDVERHRGRQYAVPVKPDG